MVPSKATEAIKAVLISSAPRLEAPGPHLNGVLPGNGSRNEQEMLGLAHCLYLSWHGRPRKLQPAVQNVGTNMYKQHEKTALNPKTLTIYVQHQASYLEVPLTQASLRIPVQRVVDLHLYAKDLAESPAAHTFPRTSQEMVEDLCLCDIQGPWHNHQYHRPTFAHGPM